MMVPPLAEVVGCDAVSSRGFAACDGELSERELAAINVHLQHCVACRTRFMGDAAFLRALRSAGRLERAPTSLRERVLNLLREHATEDAAT